MKRKTIIIVFTFIHNLPCSSQELINFYKNWDQAVANTVTYTAPVTGSFYGYLFYEGPPYNGEYKVSLSRIPWGSNNLIEVGTDLHTYLDHYSITYDIEVVSFPFSMDCAFASDGNDGGCNFGTTRELILPSAGYYDSNTNGWVYPITTPIVGLTQFLSNKISDKECTRSASATLSSEIKAETIISKSFMSSMGPDNARDILPHSVLKHTYYLHCGPNPQSAPIINSFSFLVDLTRGKMREYPFSNANIDITSISAYDVIISPELYAVADDYQSGENCTNYNIPSAQTNICTANYGNTMIGGTLDLFPYSDINDNGCDGIESSYVPVDDPSDSWMFNFLGQDNYRVSRLPIPPTTIVLSTFVRSTQCAAPAGYNNLGGNTNYQNGTFESIVTPGQEIIHKYTIDKFIDLGIINPSEKIIYNPSEVYITCPASENLHFPSGYTFKTIRATYPFDYYVHESNTVENGGPYNNLRDVPVITDLGKDYHISGYPAGDPKYSSIYHLESGSKLTIEPCVKLFDCTFEINPGSEIVFENTPTNINKQRYQLLYKGGTVTERALTFTLPEPTGSYTETRSILRYESAEPLVAAGQFGNYAVASGADVTFASELQVVLKDGFRANQGSKFHAYITPVNLPGCNGSRIGRENSEGNFSDSFSKNGDFFLAPSVTGNSSNMHFKVVKDGYYTIEVMNSLGEIKKTVYSNRYFKSEDYSVLQDFTDLAPGVYLCTLTGNNQQVSTKFIKSN